MVVCQKRAGWRDRKRWLRLMPSARFATQTYRWSLQAGKAHRPMERKMLRKGRPRCHRRSWPWFRGETIWSIFPPAPDQLPLPSECRVLLGQETILDRLPLDQSRICARARTARTSSVHHAECLQLVVPRSQRCQKDDFSTDVTWSAIR